MCYAELKKGRLVGPVGKICFMPRPLYALCDKRLVRLWFQALPNYGLCHMRQGNDNVAVAIYRYVTEGSFDAYMWQALETTCVKVWPNVLYDS